MLYSAELAPKNSSNLQKWKSRFKNRLKTTKTYPNFFRIMNVKYKNIFNLRLLKNKMFGSVFNMTTTGIMILTGEKIPFQYI